MAESETETRGPERPNKPALPPFGGPGAAAGPVLRPSTDLRGRKTLPPFFAPPVRVGGPLPGAAPRPSVRPGRLAAPEAQVIVTAPEPVQARSEPVTPVRPITPPAPSWDTPPMPVAVTVATLTGPDVGGGAGIAARPTVEAEWTPPLSDPRARRAVEEKPVEAPSVVSAPAADVVPPNDLYEPEASPDPEYATTAHEPLALEGAAPPSVPDTEEPVSLEFADKAEAPQEESEAQPPALPPTPFEDAPLSALQGTASDASHLAPDVAYSVRSEDITDMSAEPYTAPAPAPPPVAAVAAPASVPVTPRRSARKTPPLGTARVGHAGPAGGRAQAAARIGRRVTPVLSQAITPMSVPTIRRTPMAPSTAVERAPVSPPSAVAAAALSPTPIAVPVLQDIVASRAVAHALETVAARVRAGQIVIAGQVPIGDDVAALGAAVAAALAALLGVQR
jgi:hypothetical protein